MTNVAKLYLPIAFVTILYLTRNAKRLFQTIVKASALDDMRDVGNKRLTLIFALPRYILLT